MTPPPTSACTVHDSLASQTVSVPLRCDRVHSPVGEKFWALLAPHTSNRREQAAPGDAPASTMPPPKPATWQVHDSDVSSPEHCVKSESMSWLATIPPPKSVDTLQRRNSSQPSSSSCVVSSHSFAPSNAVAVPEKHRSTIASQAIERSTPTSSYRSPNCRPPQRQSQWSSFQEQFACSSSPSQS